MTHCGPAGLTHPVALWGCATGSPAHSGISIPAGKRRPRRSGRGGERAGRAGKAPPPGASRKLPPLPYKGRRATPSAPRPWNAVTAPRCTNASPGEDAHRAEGLSSWLWLSPSREAETPGKERETRGSL